MDSAVGGFYRLGRVLIVCVVLAGVLLWRPGYQAWGLVTAGLLLAWTIWLVDGIARRQKRLPGHPIHFILLGLGLIFVGHVLFEQYFADQPSELKGNINVSMLFHLCLLGLGIMLTQSFFGQADGSVRRRGDNMLLSVIGLGIMLGTGIVIISGKAGPAKDALWLLCFSGVCIWLTPLLLPRQAETDWEDVLNPYERGVIALRLLVAGFAVLILIIESGGAGRLWLAIGAAALVGLLYIFCYLRRLSAVWIVAAVALAGVVWLVLVGNGTDHFTAGIFGLGEGGFAFVSGGDSGLAILRMTTGYGGAILLAGGAVALAIWILVHVRKASPSQLGRAAVWTLATIASTVALLAPGGYASPATAVAFMFTWGQLARMANLPEKRWPPWVLIVAAIAAIVIIDITNGPGVVARMGISYQLNDKVIHGVVGFTLAMMLGWWMGAWKWWAGLAGIFLAAGLGGVGELLQKLLSSRCVELADWRAHSLGATIALGVYFLAIADRSPVGREKAADLRTSSKLRIYRSWGFRIATIVASVIIMVFWSGYVFRLFAERSRQHAYFIITDDLALKDRKNPLYLPGMSNLKYAGFVSTLISVSSVTNRLEMPWNTDRKGYIKIYPKVPHIAAGENCIRIKGTPFGPFSLDVQDVLLIGVCPGEKVYGVDARDAAEWLNQKPREFHNLMKILRQRGIVAFIHPGPAQDFSQCRKELRTEFPNIPAVCDVTYDSGARRTFSHLKHTLRINPRATKTAMFVITSHEDFAAAARRSLGKSMAAHLIGTDADSDKPNSQNWLSRYDNIQTYCVFLQATPSN